MNNTSTPATRQPIITKYIHKERTGITAQYFSRLAIGYIARGVRNVYYGDICYTINAGELFCMPPGHYFTEEIPEGGKSFEQVVFFASMEQISSVMARMAPALELHIEDRTIYDKTDVGQMHISTPSWPAIRSFFTSTTQYLREGVFEDQSAEMFKLAEILYLIITRPDCAIHGMVMTYIDLTTGNMEQVVHQNLFCDISIDQLAAKCHRSPSAFKKDFRRIFNDSPRRWLTSQRLTRARMLLSSTELPISEVGRQSGFSNASHFIRVFKKQYQTTPAQYRSRV